MQISKCKNQNDNAKFKNEFKRRLYNNEPKMWLTPLGDANKGDQNELN